MRHPQSCTRLATLPALLLSLTAAAQTDGALDQSFGDAGRSVFGFLESDSPRLRAVQRFAPSGRIMSFADDPNDPSALYLTRSLPNGQPDPSFGSNADGRRRIVLPADLQVSAEQLDLAGAIFQSDGKPLIYGGLRPLAAIQSDFPGLVCRLTAAGTLDPGFDGDGCRTIRNGLDPEEVCRVEDAVFDAAARVLVVGNCIDGTSSAERPFLARLNPAGGLDIEFAGGLGLVTPAPPAAGISSQRYRAVALNVDGTIRVLGEFTVEAGDQSQRDLGVLAFDGGGSIDPAFSGDGLATVAFDVALDRHHDALDLGIAADGRLLLLGQARRVSSLSTVALLARLLPNGSLDGSFDGDGRKIEDFDGRLSLAARLGGFDLDPQGRLLIAASEIRGTPAAEIDSGTDFRFHLPPSVPPDIVARLHIAAEQTTSGTVSGPTLGAPIPFTVQAGQATLLDLPASLISLPAQGSASTDNRSLRVQANAPVQVTGLLGRNASLASMTLLPQQRLGRDYRILAWRPGLGVGSLFSVVGTQDNTTVLITLSASIGGNPPQLPYSINLNAGEVYYGYTSLADISGTRISSSHPVAVFAGHTCATVPIQGTDFCDASYEQQLPIEASGRLHVAMPTRADGDVLRIVADLPNTAVYRNGLRIASLQRGQRHDVLFSTPAVFSTSRPAAVAQLGRGCTLAPDFGPENCPGDPFLLRIEPVERWSSRQRVVLPVAPVNTQAPQHALYVAMPTAAVPSLRIDGAPSAAAFQTVAGTGYSWARIPMQPGSYLLSADAPFLAHALRQAAGEAYAHTGGVLGRGATGASLDAEGTDQVVRLRADGSRDPSFGEQGRVALPRPGFLSVASSIRADGDGILIGSALRQLASGQHLLQVTRLQTGAIFRDGFESP